MTQLINTYVPETGYVGIGVETAKNVPVAATDWANLLSDKIEHDPAPILPKLLRGVRQTAFQPAAGEQKLMGPIEVPLYPDQNLQLLAAAIGADVWQYGVNASSGTTIGSAVPAGATVFAIAAQPGTALSTGAFIELHQGLTGSALSTGNLSEVHKIAGFTGSGPFTVTLASGESMQASYGTTGTVYNAGSSQYGHVVLPDYPDANSYKTLTIEKNFANIQRRQYAGCTVAKAALKAATNDVVKVTYDIAGMSDAVLATPSSPVFATSAPFALANLAPSLFGTPDNSIASFDMAIDNVAPGVWTFAGGNLPTAVPMQERTITGKMTNVAQDITYYTKAIAITTGAQSWVFTIGQQSLTLSLPKFQFTKFSAPLQVGKVFIYESDWSADWDDTALTDIKATYILTSKYLPIV